MRVEHRRVDERLADEAVQIVVDDAVGGRAVPPEAAGDEHQQARAKEQQALALQVRLAQSPFDRAIAHGGGGLEAGDLGLEEASYCAGAETHCRAARGSRPRSRHGAEPACWREMRTDCTFSPIVSNLRSAASSLHVPRIDVDGPANFVRRREAFNGI